MPYDYSGASDAQLTQAASSPFLSPEARVAASVELARRSESSRAKPDNIEQNLEAASTPVTPDPDMKPAAEKTRTWRDMSDEEMLAPLADAPGGGVGATQGDLPAYGARYQQAVANTIDRGVAARQAARKRGYQDPDQVAYNRATGLSEDEAGVPLPGSQPGLAAPAGPPVQMINGKPYVNIDGAIYPADSSMVEDPGEYQPTDYGHGTMMVDGVRVPIAEPADALLGEPAKYRLVDVERERQKMAAHQSRSTRRQWSIEDNRKFGSPYLPPDQWSEEQVGARVNRREGEIRQMNTGSAHRQRIVRLAEALNVSEDVAAAAYQDALNKIPTGGTDRPEIAGARPNVYSPIVGAGYAPGDLLNSQDLLTPAGFAHVESEARRSILADSANNGAVDVKRERKKAAQDMFLRRRLAQSNPLEYLGQPGINDWQQMAVAEQFLRQPQAMTPLGVEAVGAANAMRLLNSDIFSQGIPGAAQAAADRLASTRMEELRKAAAAGGAATFGGGREGAERALKRAGATRPERKEILDDLYGPEDAADAPPSAGTFPGQAPAPPPSNPGAAPRPYG